MVLVEFINETSRIEQFFSKELTKIQRDEWFRELKNISIQRYRQIVQEIFRKCKFMPKLADVLEIQNSLAYNTLEVKKVECSKCDGTGYVIYKKHFKDGIREYDLDYATRCSCANGMSKNKNIPLISEVGLR